MRRDQRLDDDVVDVAPDLLEVVAAVPQPAVHGGDAAVRGESDSQGGGSGREVERGTEGWREG